MRLPIAGRYMYKFLLSKIIEESYSNLSEKYGTTVDNYESNDSHSTFYAPEAHIMYVPYSCLLISNKFCNGGGGERPEQGEQVPLCTCSSTPLSRDLW